MTYRILTKKSNVPELSPHPTELLPGELALNYSDMILYALDSGGNVQPVSSGSDGGGDLIAMDYTFWVKVVQEGQSLVEFEGQDDTGNEYEVNVAGFDVALNGVSIIPNTDYVINDTRLTLGEPAEPGDVIIIRSLKASDGVSPGVLTTNDIALLGDDTTTPAPMGYQEWVADNSLRTQQDANWFLLHRIDELEIPEDQDLSTYETIVKSEADDQALQIQIDALSASGGYNDSWIQPAIDAGDDTTLADAKAYTDGEVAAITHPDPPDLAPYETIVKSKADDADTLVAAKGYTDQSLLPYETKQKSVADDAATLNSAKGYSDQKLNDGLSKCVQNTGGDDMQGPLHIKNNGGDTRATNRVTTLGVFSNSDSSALRLGTTRDRVYIGHNDTSINGPLKIDELQEKTDGGGIFFTHRTIFTQPEGTNKEGFSVQGKTDEGENKKLLSVYHNSDGIDAVNYHGKQDSNTNIATVGHVQSQVDSLQQSINDLKAEIMDDLKAEIEAERFNNILHDSPFVSKTNNTQLYYSSNSGALPPNERLFGLYYDGSSMTSNRFPSNWNSHLRVGNGVVAIDRNGSKVDIPLGYNEDWTGSVSIYEFEPVVSNSKTKLSLIYKNSVHNIRRSSGNNCVYITFGTEKDGYERHAPIFSRGDVSGDLADKKVIMLLDVYRIGDRDDPEGGNRNV